MSVNDFRTQMTGCPRAIDLLSLFNAQWRGVVATEEELEALKQDWAAAHESKCVADDEGSGSNVARL